MFITKTQVFVHLSNLDGNKNTHYPSCPFDLFIIWAKGGSWLRHDHCTEMGRSSVLQECVLKNMPHLVLFLRADVSMPRQFYVTWDRESLRLSFVKGTSS